MTAYPTRGPLLLAALFALSLTPANAQLAAEDDDTVEFDPIVVTADPLARGELDSTRPVSVLDGQALDRAQAATLGETLDGELGVANSSFGGGAGRPVIRGQSGPRVRVLDGGLGTLDVSSLSPDHNVSIEPFRAEQIEVLRGPASLLFGSGAIGGVVNVVTDTIPTAPVDQVDFSLGTQFDSARDGRSLFGHVEFSAGPLAFHIDGQTRRTDDLEIDGFADADAAEEGADPSEAGTLENSYTDTETGAFGVSWAGSRGFLGAAVTQYDTVYGIPGHGHHDEGGGEEAEEEGGVFLDVTQVRYDLRGELSNPLAGLARLRGAVVKNDYKHIEFEGPGEPGTVFTNDAVEARLEASHAEIGALRGVFGLQVVDRDFQAIGEEAFVVVPVNTQQTSLFVVEEFGLGPVTLEAGGRIERVDLTADGAANRDFDATSLSLGLNWALTDALRFAVSASASERAPVAEELYSNGPHLATETFELGSLALDVETANNIDVSLHWHGERLFGHVSLFTTQYDDYIFQAFVDSNNDGEADLVTEEGALPGPGEEGELLLVNYTQADADFAGGEAELGAIIVPRGPLGEWSLRVFGDTVSGELDGGQNLPRITPTRIGVGLDWSRGILNASLKLTEVDEADDLAPLETPTDGYSLLSADFDWTVNTAGTVKLGLRGRNLLDEEVRLHTSFIKDIAPQAGRSLILDARYEFR